MKTVVLCGGISTERDVSLTSGRMIYEALMSKGHEAVLLDIYLGYEGDTDGVFEKKANLLMKNTGISEVNPDIEEIKKLRKDGGRGYFGPNVIKLCMEADVVFMALHGIGGEDGKVQACFDLMGIKYTGTDFTSAAMAMDKGIAKDIFRAYGIPTPDGFRLGKGEKEPRRIPYPCIVKACNGGSSVGTALANNDEEYEKAKAEAFKYDNEAVVEQYIKGREFSDCVIDGKALPVIEIAPKVGFYDYKNKYQAGSTVETCPAEIPDDKTKEIQHIAEEAFKALRYRGYARMDFMMSEDGTVYCLEANTLPGMTPTSLIPQEAAVLGISFEDLCEKILLMGARE
ncbi:MAG: D-alanine--D-alanine ligase [Lachnospiraceae bacterium]|nr:D-alanine--D-alanine ligase [Lachnospiraceae bacterium]